MKKVGNNFFKEERARGKYGGPRAASTKVSGLSTCRRCYTRHQCYPKSGLLATVPPNASTTISAIVPTTT
jgi:hypothetical protein